MKISFKNGGRGKVTIYCGDEKIASVDEDFVLSCGCKDSDELDGAQLAAFIQAVRLRSAFLGAMRLVSLRDHGRKELENKLVAKGHKREFASQACEMLVDRNLLNDEEYAVSLAKRLNESKGLSVKRIKSELLMRGISHEIADIACENIDNEPIMRIIDILKTKYSGKLSTEKEVRKAFNALLRMGYGYSDIRSALSQLDCETDPEE